MSLYKFSTAVFFFIAITAFRNGHSGTSMHRLPIVLDFGPDSGNADFIIDTKTVKALKAHYKERKFFVISKEEAQMILQKQMSEIFIPDARGFDIEKYKEEAKKKIVSLPESSTWVNYIVYSKNQVVPDSVLMKVTSFPYNANKSRLYQKVVLNCERKELVPFLNDALDSCIANKFFD